MTNVKEYEDPSSDEEEKPQSQQLSLTVDKKPIKDFNKAFNQLVKQKTSSEIALVSQTDIAKAEKANYLSQLKFDDVTARLWQSHSNHLDRIETMRKEVEE